MVGGGHTSLKGGGGQRDFSCPGQKCPALDAPSSRPTRRLPGSCLPYPAPPPWRMMICVIFTSTCMRRGSASNTPACSRLNGGGSRRAKCGTRGTRTPLSLRMGGVSATAGWESGHLRRGSKWRIYIRLAHVRLNFKNHKWLLIHYNEVSVRQHASVHTSAPLRPNPGNNENKFQVKAKLQSVLRTPPPRATGPDRRLAPCQSEQCHMNG